MFQVKVVDISKVWINKKEPTDWQAQVRGFSEGDYSVWPRFISGGTQLLDKDFQLFAASELFGVVTVFFIG
jgi:hypothetical protein